MLYKSRSPRPGEKDGEDYHFRRREEIENLREKENFVVMEVRGDLQAFDLKKLHGLLKIQFAFHRRSFVKNPTRGYPCRPGVNLMHLDPKQAEIGPTGYVTSPCLT